MRRRRRRCSTCVVDVRGARFPMPEEIFGNRISGIGNRLAKQSQQSQCRCTPCYPILLNGGLFMRRNQAFTIAAIAILAIGMMSLAACKTSGMALTQRGQVLKLNIEHPTDLPEQGEDNLGIVVSNRGVKDIKNVMVDVELPPQLIVLDQTNEREVMASHDSGSNMYHFTSGNVNVGEDVRIGFRVRTAFGTYRETGSVKVTAWQSDLPGDKLVETAVIKLRQ